MQEEEEASPEPSAPAWMATFSDLATLLLTFFVLLLSFANMDVQNFRVALGSVKDALGVQVLHPGDFEARANSPVELSDNGASMMNVQVVERESLSTAHIMRTVREKGLQGKVSVHKTDRGIMLRIHDTVLFGAGSADLREDGYPALETVAELAAQFSGNMSIEGHSDSLPIRSNRFPSNWELSAARATAVLRFLVDKQQLPVERLGIAGYADIRPLNGNNTPAERAQNRRVEFVFVKSDGVRPTHPVFN